MSEQSMRRLERRIDSRYRFEQPVRFACNGHCDISHGAGQIVDMGSGGVLFRSECPPPNGASLELYMKWPLLAQGVCPVILVMHGTVVRTDARGTSVRMDRYVFQTAESCAFESAMSAGDVCNLIG